MFEVFHDFTMGTFLVFNHLNESNRLLALVRLCLDAPYVIKAFQILAKLKALSRNLLLNIDILQ